MPDLEAALHFHTAFKTVCGFSYENLQANITDKIKNKFGCMGSGACRRPNGPKILEVLHDDDDLTEYS